MKVFSKEKWFKDYLERNPQQALKEITHYHGWVDDCDGKVVENERCLGYLISYDWCVDEDVKTNSELVADEIERILEIGDDLEAFDQIKDLVKDLRSGKYEN